MPAHHVGNRPGEVLGIAGRDQHAVATVSDRLGNARHVRGHHRHAGGHRFKHDHRQALAKQTRHDQQIHPPQLVGHVAREARPRDVIAELQPPHAGGNLGFILRRLECTHRAKMN